MRSERARRRLSTTFNLYPHRSSVNFALVTDLIDTTFFKSIPVAYAFRVETDIGKSFNKMGIKPLPNHLPKV